MRYVILEECTAHLPLTREKFFHCTLNATQTRYSCPTLGGVSDPNTPRQCAWVSTCPTGTATISSNFAQLRPTRSSMEAFSHQKASRTFPDGNFSSRNVPKRSLRDRCWSYWGVPKGVSPEIATTTVVPPAVGLVPEECREWLQDHRESPNRLRGRGETRALAVVAWDKRKGMGEREKSLGRRWSQVGQEYKVGRQAAEPGAVGWNV